MSDGRLHRACLWFVSACACAACQVAPARLHPQAPTAPEYPAEYSQDVTVGERATDIGWRDFFEDPRLELLITSALTRNRDLAVAVAGIEEARGLFRIQQAERYPTVGLSADVSRNRAGLASGAATGTSGQIQGTGVQTGDTGETTPDAVSFTRSGLSVGVSAFELDFWGRVRNASEAARFQYLSTIQGERAFRLTLVRSVATTYLSVLEADARIRLAEATVESRREGLRIAKVRLDAGITSALDFRQAESLLTQAEAELAGLRQRRAIDENALTVLVGGPLASPLPDPLPLARQTRTVTLAAGLPSDLLVARPDILAAEQQLRAAGATIGAARAAFFPTISLTSALGFSSTELDDLFGSRGFQWNAGPSLTAPIFNRQALRGNLTVAEARADIAVANYELTIQTAFQEVADALAGRRYLAEQVAAQTRNVTALQQIAELANIRYREGTVGYLEVLDAERNLFAAQQALLQLQRAEVDNLVALYIVLGGGQVGTK